MRSTPVIVLGLIVALATCAWYFVGHEAAPANPSSTESFNDPPKPAAQRPNLERSAHSVRIGMNLSGVVDWSREWAFVDIFRHSRSWHENGPKPFVFDERGYPLLKPGQSVESLMVREIEGHYPPGKYVVTWSGEGKVQLGRFDVSRIIDTSPGRIEVDVKPGDGGLLLEIKESSTTNPVGDIHVWMPGFEKAKSPFHPLFLERLKGFEVLRFMDWQRTNNCPLVAWDNRPRVSDARYTTDAGVPIEILIDLANSLQIAPWFCVPHKADDEYVRQFAKLVRERLDPKLKIYVEYSNEVWNWGFSQSHFAVAEAKRLGVGDPGQFRYYSQRAVEVFRLWEQEFGGRDRLVRILATQAVNLWGAEQTLTFQNAYKHADALAIAPYFGHEFGDPKSQLNVAGWSVDALLDKVAAEIDGPNRDMIRKQAQLARKYGLDLMAYEGGPHMVGFLGAENNKGITELFIKANRHSRMYDLQRRHLENWFASGGGLYAAFAYVAAPSKWGSWGVLEYQDQPLEKAPKMRAILDLMNANKRKQGNAN